MSKKPNSPFVSLSEVAGDLLIDISTPEMLGEAAYSAYIWTVKNSRRPSTYISKLKSIAKKKDISNQESALFLNHVHLYEKLDREDRVEVLLSIQENEEKLDENEFNRYITHVLNTMPENASDNKTENNEEGEDTMPKQTQFGQYTTNTTVKNKFERPEGQAVLYLYDFMQDVTSYEDFVLKLEDERKRIGKMYRKLLNRRDVTDFSIDLINAVFGLLKYNEDTTRELVMGLKSMTTGDHEKFWNKIVKFLTSDGSETVDNETVQEVKDTLEDVQNTLEDVKDTLEEIETISVNPNTKPEDLDLYNLRNEEIHAYVRARVLEIGKIYMSKVNGSVYTMELKYKGGHNFQFTLKDKVA